MRIDFSQLSLKERYKIMSRTIVPRPIAWIVTEGESLNIAPFSYFMALSSEPPTLIVSIGHKKDGTPKDTLANIRSQKRCTICFVTPEQLSKMHQSSEALPSEISEASRFGIATTKIHPHFPPIIDASPAAFMCTLHQEIDLGGKTVPLILKIEEYYIDDDLYDENYEFDFHFVARVGKGYRLCDKEIEP